MEDSDYTLERKIKIGKEEYTCTFDFDFRSNHLFKDATKDKNYFDDHYSNNSETSHTLLNLFELAKAFESGKITFIPNVYKDKRFSINIPNSHDFIYTYRRSLNGNKSSICARNCSGIKLEGTYVTDKKLKFSRLGSIIL